jgi:PadR family transcriptional regulator, regulatory protein AphA
MSLKHGILGLLNYLPRSGYDLMKTFNDSLGHFWMAQPSQIYRELNNLSADGLIRASGKVQNGHITKTLHEITDAGRVELSRWLSSAPANRSEAVKSVFLLKLFFQARLGKEAVREMLTAMKTRSEAEAANLRSSGRETAETYAARGEPLEAFCWKATLDYGIANYEMVSRWAAMKLAELEDIPDLKRKEGALI